MRETKKSAVPSIRRALVRVRDIFPITWLGLAVGAVGAAVLRFYAFAKLDLVLLVLGYGALAVLAVAALLVLVASIVVRVRLARVPDSATLSLETGRFVETGFSIPSLRFVPLLASSTRMVEPLCIDTRLAASRGRLRESIRVNERGDYPTRVRTVTIADVFGLVRMTLRLREAEGVRAVPHTGGIRDMPTLRSLAAGDADPHPLGVDEGDRMDLRRYAPGDPARFVNWKAFARTGRLVVRVPERAFAPSRRVVAYFVPGEADEASAGAARAAVERTALGTDFVFGADGTEGAVRTAAEAVDLLVRSAAARHEGALGLRAFLERADRDGPATVVLFVPSRHGEWVSRVLEVARERRAPMRVVVGVDGLVPTAARSWVESALVAPLRRDGESLEAVLSLREALASARAEVLVLDRVSGRLLAAPSSSAASIAAIAGQLARDAERAA